MPMAMPAVPIPVDRGGPPSVVRVPATPLVIPDMINIGAGDDRRRRRRAERESLRGRSGERLHGGAGYGRNKTGFGKA